MTPDYFLAKFLFVFLFVFKFIFCVSILGCSLLPSKKAMQIQCPDTIGTAKGDIAIDAMPISTKEAVVICGHREDNREDNRENLKRRNFMRLSEFEILQYNIDSDTYTQVWKADALDVRHVRMLKTEKQIEIVQSVFNSDSKPIPIIRDILNCTGKKCEAGQPLCMFKKDPIKYQKLLPKKGSFKSWLQEQDSENRATVLFLNAASGHKKSAQLVRSESIEKMSEDGHFANVMRGYRELLVRVATVCVDHQ